MVSGDSRHPAGYRPVTSGKHTASPLCTTNDAARFGWCFALASRSHGIRRRLRLGRRDHRPVDRVATRRRRTRSARPRAVPAGTRPGVLPWSDAHLPVRISRPDLRAARANGPSVVARARRRFRRDDPARDRRPRSGTGCDPGCDRVRAGVGRRLLGTDRRRRAPEAFPLARRRRRRHALFAGHRRARGGAGS